MYCHNNYCGGKTSLVYQTTPSPALDVVQYIQSWGGSGRVHETSGKA